MKREFIDDEAENADFERDKLTKILVSCICGVPITSDNFFDSAKDLTPVQRKSPTLQKLHCLSRTKSDVFFQLQH